MNFTYKRTSSNHQDFQYLVGLLDEDLAIRDGDEHDFYHQYNGIENLDCVIVIYHGDQAIGCGAIKKYNDYTFEVKRMFVLNEYRGRRIATSLLNRLESWAKELSASKLILETGIRNPEARALYQRAGFEVIDNYDQYIGMDNSICFAKSI